MDIEKNKVDKATYNIQRKSNIRKYHSSSREKRTTQMIVSQIEISILQMITTIGWKLNGNLFER